MAVRLMVFKQNTKHNQHGITNSTELLACIQEVSGSNIGPETDCVYEICVLLRYYAASDGNPLPTFRDNVSVPQSKVKKWTS
jgi:hypothetical protein